MSENRLVHPHGHAHDPETHHDNHWGHGHPLGADFEDDNSPYGYEEGLTNGFFFTPFLHSRAAVQG